MDKALCLLLLTTWEFCPPNAPIPQKAIIAGHDSDGSPLYVGRAIHEGDQLPGKVAANRHMAYVSYGGREYRKSAFDVLVNGNVSWVRSGFGEVPRNAILGGRTWNGEPLYIGRANYRGSLAPGKIFQRHRTLYISYGGREISIRDYEVLVEN
ncbi:uncharacterized protein LOC131215006 [Anopheles bellator]|uniref:uncharacterized protein LOC131215006 n=1 Tax=Anopheles bellator TaxID=139047 RepID=UPI00264869F2|nr:uncharacterized protein LOC131215006 [Anopheles bellator]